MDYTETVNLITTPILRDLALLASILIPSLIGIWNLTHTKVTKDAVTPNHGSSMRDSVNRIETQVEGFDPRFAAIEEHVANFGAQLEEHLRIDTPCQHGNQGKLADG